MRCHFAEGGTKVMVSEQYVLRLVLFPSSLAFFVADGDHSRYLQNLQKQAEENRRRRRPSSASNGDTMNQQQGDYHYRLAVGPQSLASASGPSSSHQHRSPTTAMPLNEQRRMSAVTQSNRTGRPAGVRRHHSDDGFGLQHGARSNGAHSVHGVKSVTTETGLQTGPDSTLISPTPAVGASQQRPDTAPSTGPASGSAPPYGDHPSPLSVWSNPFEIPSMIIQRPNRDNRTWSECRSKICAIWPIL